MTEVSLLKLTKETGVLLATGAAILLAKGAARAHEAARREERRVEECMMWCRIVNEKFL